MKQLVWLLMTSIAVGMLALVGLERYRQDSNNWLNDRQRLEKEREILLQTVESKNIELDNWLKNDQVLINKEQSKTLLEINKSLKVVASTYEHLVDLKSDSKQHTKLDDLLALILNQLGDYNYASAEVTTKNLEDEIKKAQEKRALALAAAVKSGPVGSATETVKTVNGEFKTNIISADLRTTKVVVDTASPADCADNCPVLPLATFAQRSGAFAAINGPYFCPSSYPACANKKNSFDTLMMNKNKTYFNSGNNVYSSVPAAIFSTTSRFVRQSSEWGRDTGIDSVIAGQPLLVFNGQSMFAGDGDPKKSGKGTRAFIGATDNTVYIGLVYNVTVAEMANVVAAKGIRNAINLDSGGSIALWNNGRYVAGPGRDLPFGIMLVRR